MDSTKDSRVIFHPYIEISEDRPHGRPGDTPEDNTEPLLRSSSWLHRASRPAAGVILPHPDRVGVARPGGTGSGPTALGREEERLCNGPMVEAMGVGVPVSGARTITPTKFICPSPGSHWVCRSQVASLLQTERWRLALVAAGAASGKTTAVAQWFLELSAHRVWITLDERDGSAERFWPTLVAGLDQAMPGTFAASVNAAGAAQVSGERVVDQLLLDFGSVTGRLVIVLDNLQVVRAAAVLDAFTWLIEYLPGDVQIVVTTRTDPQLPLGRWRVRGWVLDIRTPELAFSLAEAEQLCTSLSNGRITSDEIEHLWKESEGWVAAFRVAAGSLAWRGDDDADYEDLLGRDPMMVDLLVTEVLDAQEPDIVDFLLRTCIVEQLDPEMCDALTGRCDSEVVLEEMVERLHLMTATGRPQRSYRYGPLLLETLRLELHRRLPTEVPSLARVAARVFQARAELAPAVSCLLQAGDVDEAFALTYAESYDQHDKGQPTAAAECLDLLPVELVLESSERMLVFTLCLGLVGRNDAALVWLLRVIARLESESDPRIEDLIKLDILKLLCSTILGLWPDGIEPGLRALEQIERSPDLGILGHKLRPNLARAYLLADRPQDAWNVLADAAQDGELVEMVLVPANAARCAARCGRLDEALQLAHDALSASEILGITTHFGVIDALLARTDALIERNELAEAHLAIGRMRAVAECHPEGTVYEVLTRLADVRIAAGEHDFELAFAQLRDVRVLVEKIRHPDLTATIDRLEARWRIEAGEVAFARKLVDRLEDGSSARRVLEARLSLAVGNGSDARAWLSTLLMTNSRDRLEVDVLWLRSMIEGGAAADELVAQIVEQAAPACLARTILDEGAEVARFVRNGALAAHTPDADGLAAALGALKVRPQPVGQRVEVSEREMSVLRFLPTNLSNQEIATECLMSVNTVKTHLKSIYSKFGVTSRADAVRCARARGLI